MKAMTAPVEAAAEKCVMPAKSTGKQKRVTKQKKLVLELLHSTDCHPTADWIYTQARQELPDISLGTVYRNLQVLLEEGEIQELNYGKSQSRYDGNPMPHYHFVCLECGQVLDFQDNTVSVDNSVLSAAPGQVDFYRLECYGVCKHCLAKK